MVTHLGRGVFYHGDPNLYHGPQHHQILGTAYKLSHGMTQSNSAWWSNQMRGKFLQDHRAVARIFFLPRRRKPPEGEGAASPPPARESGERCKLPGGVRTVFTILSAFPGSLVLFIVPCKGRVFFLCSSFLEFTGVIFLTAVYPVI